MHAVFRPTTAHCFVGFFFFFCFVLGGCADDDVPCCVCSSMELKDDTVIVVLGASGDLAKKKTVSIFASLPPVTLPVWRGLTTAASLFN